MIIYFRAILILAILYAPTAWAANTIINSGEGGGSVRGKLNNKLGELINVVQPPYNADPSGVSPSDSAIAAAITDACNNVAGTIFFPSGTFTVTAPIVVNCIAANGGHGQFKIVGAGRYNTNIKGSFTGYVIDHPDDDGTGHMYSGMLGLEHIQVQNTRLNLDAGAIRFNAIQTGNYIRDCQVTGYTGIEMAYNTFSGTISNCTLTMGDNNGVAGTVGIYSGQVAVRDLKMTGYDTGIVMRGIGPVISGVGVETSNTGINMGQERYNVMKASITGGVMTVTQFVAGPGINIGVSNTLLTHGCPTCNGNVNSYPGGCPNTPAGTCTLTGNYGLSGSTTSISNQTVLQINFNGSVTGASLDSLQTERNNSGIVVSNGAQSSVRNAAITGTVGVAYQAVNATWSGGTATYTLYNHPSPNTTGSADCTAESFSPSGYNFNHQTCTWAYNSTTGVTTVTATIANPGSSPASSFGFVSPKQNECLELSSTSSMVFENLSCGINAVNNLNMNTGFTTLNSVRFIGTILGGGLPNILPPSQSKAGVSYVDAATGGGSGQQGFPPLNMNIADLPGAGNSVITPIDGVEYDIVDLNMACTFNATPLVGGGSGHARVRWNSNLGHWSIVGC